ncbi:VWA domain-containing protein [Rubellicoccus peritrichatus]|uniref:VWA domain-containing protein n=1 Tax=Rubellicoccus peritrichatus TaxID=3080537 RepID=A0AAQ3LFI7_9BACT|nr:VWA domain-containing protein [Puniceicoccus sp. CR14]WOO43629.1 VWA domain-containing protein [Puniceicoccus sp. CR14]
MDIGNTFARNRALFVIVVVSLVLHLVGLVIFGAYKVVENITRNESTFEAPVIMEVSQRQPEYVVNLEQRNQSSSPSRPNPIVVDSPDVSIPTLDIDVNISDSSGYGRGAGLGNHGIGKMREMVLDVDSLKFFGKEMESEAEKMMFVIDISGSMVYEPRGIDGYKAVVAEIVKSLRGMNGAGSFNIIAFSKGVEVYRGQFQAVNDASISSAEKWLNRLDPAKELRRKGVAEISGTDYFSKYREGIHLGTNTIAALEEAFRKGANSIILLSDGKPTSSTNAAGEKVEFFSYIRTLQGEKNIPISAISYKSPKAAAFLSRLASENNGQYVNVQ